HAGPAETPRLGELFITASVPPGIAAVDPDGQLDGVAGRARRRSGDEKSAEAVVLDEAGVVIPAGTVGLRHLEADLDAAGDSVELALVHGVCPVRARNVSRPRIAGNWPVQ